MKRWMIVMLIILSGCSYLDGKQAPEPYFTIDGKEKPFAYQTICWNQGCKRKGLPDLSPQVVSAAPGSTAAVSLQYFRAKPASVYLRNMKTGEELHVQTAKLFYVTVPKQGSHYRIEFVWEDVKGNIIGRSLMEFALQPK
ncbi:hypothetical protein [Ectobacillus ponti]|uniref:Lipoprotein n=1 Tax=Ectobacillus ponti TaxID=2961894 RepID=A0AA42BPB1_9BACI|nr:hypothetical protein [Ectobacillus ponti]MCP8968231.1 hypothetical protein [Ectobacillus ponti]